MDKGAALLCWISNDSPEFVRYPNTPTMAHGLPMLSNNHPNSGDFGIVPQDLHYSHILLHLPTLAPYYSASLQILYSVFLTADKVLTSKLDPQHMEHRRGGAHLR
jgi:hypothetical protein